MLDVVFSCANNPTMFLELRNLLDVEEVWLLPYPLGDILFRYIRYGKSVPEAPICKLLGLFYIKWETLGVLRYFLKINIYRLVNNSSGTCQ